jgi:hypothetical protein
VDTANDIAWRQVVSQQYNRGMREEEAHEKELSWEASKPPFTATVP